MATPETSETTTVHPEGLRADATDGPARRIRRPMLRRGRVFDAAPVDQTGGTDRPLRAIPLPLVRRRALTTSLFDPTQSTPIPNAPAVDGNDQALRRTRLPVLRRNRSLETAAFDPKPSPTVETPTPHIGWQVEPTHRLEGFELRSVTRAALRYYACAFAVLAISVVIVWLGASMLGIVGRIEGFMRSIGFRGFQFAGFQVIVGGILLCIAGVAFLTVMTVLAAMFFNLLGRSECGVGIRLVPISPVPVAAEAPKNGNGNGHRNGNGQSNGNGNGYD